MVAAFARIISGRQAGLSALACQSSTGPLRHAIRATATAARSELRIVNVIIVDDLAEMPYLPIPLNGRDAPEDAPGGASSAEYRF